MSTAHEHAIPRRVLVVDDDEMVRETIAGLLKAADFEVATANDGAEALTLLGRQWYPVVVTDRNMPVIDGIEFVQRLRAVAVSPAYVIMLTMNNDAQDYERGYCAGIDHYASKKGYEGELVNKVLAGITAIRRRQSASASQSDGPVTVDLETGAHTARHLVGRLHAEIAHATRRQLSLHVLSVCIEADKNGRNAELAATASDALLRAVRSAVRPKIDWVARLPAARSTYRLAIIMPESVANDILAVEQGIRNAFVHSSQDPVLRATTLSMGYAGVDKDKQPTALELLGEAERQRRGITAKPAADLRNVQTAPESAAASEAA
jgi:DNA-binding response OmpR family regulator